MPISPPSSALTTTWEARITNTPDDTPRASMPAAYTELDPALERRSRVAQNHFDELAHYAEDTHPDSARMLEARRPQSLPPTYWQAMGKDSPLPEHVEDDVLPPTYEQATNAGEGALRFDSSLSGRALAEAIEHVRRLDDLLNNAEELRTLLLNHPAQNGTPPIDVDAVADLCLKIDSLRTAWAHGLFDETSRGLNRMADTCVPDYRVEREDELKASIAELWNAANTEYQEKYLPDPSNAHPILSTAYVMAERLKKADI